MPNTVLGKVSCVPRGDYSASETYYALDIVGHEGGSYLAMKESTGVTPSNDQVNWMQLSGPGLPGADGVTFTPSVSEAGEISWTNDGEKENPEPVDIMGPPGAAAGFGTVTATADNTSSETPSVDVQASGPDTAKNFAFAFSGLKGNPGETPDITIGTVTTLEPGQDATAEITGTTPDLVLSLGLPKGQPGTSVSRIQRTDGTGAAGTTDTYTMYDSDGGEIGTFTVYNGSNGTGSGDFMANGTVPMTGALNMGGNRVTNVGAPTASTDAVRQSDLQAVSDEVDHILDGTTPAYIPAATETKVGGIKPGTGLEVESDGTANVTLTGVPSGGTTGQILTQGASGPEWEDAPDTGVTKFNGRTGEVEPQEGDYTASMVGARPATWTPTASEVGAVPTSRTVNGKPLSSNISLTADDVGAANPPALRTATLSASGWSGNSQTVTVQGVETSGQSVRISPATKTDADNWVAAGVWCSEPTTANQLVFTCDTAPTENININVELQEVQS